MTVKLVYWRYIGGLQTFGAILDGELHLLAFHEIAVTVHLDGREVDEHIRSVFPGDETISLVAVEPLDCADDTIRHFTSNSFTKYVSSDAYLVPSEQPTKMTQDMRLGPLSFLRPTVTHWHPNRQNSISKF